MGLRRNPGAIEGGHHDLKPAVARGLINFEGSVTHPQARMAALLNVVLRATKAKNQESAQTFFRGAEIAALIHRTEDVVGGDLTIKGGNKSAKSFFSDG